MGNVRVIAYNLASKRSWPWLDLIEPGVSWHIYLQLPSAKFTALFVFAVFYIFFLTNYIDYNRQYIIGYQILFCFVYSQLICAIMCITKKLCLTAILLLNILYATHEIWTGETPYLILYIFQSLQTIYIHCRLICIRHDCNITVSGYLGQHEGYMVYFHITNRNEEQIFHKIYLIRAKGKNGFLWYV